MYNSKHFEKSWTLFNILRNCRDKHDRYENAGNKVNIPVPEQNYSEGINIEAEDLNFCWSTLHCSSSIFSNMFIIQSSTVRLIYTTILAASAPTWRKWEIVIHEGRDHLWIFNDLSLGSSFPNWRHLINFTDGPELSKFYDTQRIILLFECMCVVNINAGT